MLKPCFLHLSEPAESHAQLMLLHAFWDAADKNLPELTIVFPMTAPYSFQRW
jgi:hypothetical protein